jgi:putative oxidoreductase
MEPATHLHHNRHLVDLSLLLLRLVVGTVFVAHGSQLLFGAFGGPGITKAVESLKVGWVGYLVVIGQFFGGIGLILGFLTRFSAASLIVIMIGAIMRVHLPHGFFSQKGGYEFNLALIGLLLPILLLGPGRFAIGHLFLPRSKRTRRPIIILE